MNTRAFSRRRFLTCAARASGAAMLAGTGVFGPGGCARRGSVEKLSSIMERVRSYHRGLGGLPDNPVAVAQTDVPIEYPYVGDPAHYDRGRNPCYGLLEEAVMLLNPDNLENPLSHLVRPGDTVVIKPNWCTQLIFPIPITHPSLVHAAAELCARAGAAKVRIVEAPMTMNHGATWFYGPVFLNMKPWLEYLSARYPGTVFEHQDGNADDFVWVDLGDRSMLHDLPLDVLCHDAGPITSDMFFDVADAYGVNPKVYRQGLYAIAKSYLDADVFINFSKMKTHMWTGITIALKNFMGLNVISTVHRMPPEVQKAYLRRNNFADLRECGMRDVPHFDRRFYRYELRFQYNRHNDVLWRSLADLNRIVQYCDVRGKLHEARRRRCLHLVDGVVGTDGAGPISRTRVYSRTIVAGYDPVRVDAVCSRIMSYDPRQIILVRASSEQVTELPIGTMTDYESSVLCPATPGRMPHVHPYEVHKSWLPDGHHNIYYKA